MFAKKTFKPHSEVTLSKQNVKKLAGDVEVKFSGLNKRAFDKFVDKRRIVCVKEMKPSVVTVYSVDATPMFVDVTGKMDLYPTTYCVDELYGEVELMPRIVIKPPVLEFLLKGADLMLPGVDMNATDFGLVYKHQMVSVHLSGSPVCVAIGRCLVDQATIDQNGLQGKAVSIVLCVGDAIWQYGPQTQLDKAQQAIEERMSKLRLEQQSDDHDDAANDENENTSNDITDAADEHGKQEIEPGVSTDDMLVEYFQAAIHKLKDKQLPMLTSEFFSQHVMQLKPEDVSFDIKKTKWKKVLVFLREMQQLGVITLHEKSKGVFVINSIVRDTEQYTSWRRNELLFPGSSVAADDQQQQQQQKQQQQQPSKMTITEVYQPHSLARFLFPQYTKDTYYANADVRREVQQYLKTHQLVGGSVSKGCALIDVDLSALLGSKVQQDEEVTLQELFTLLISNHMSTFYCIQHPNGSVDVRRGKIPTIAIIVKSAGNKRKVTLVQNLETVGINVKDVATHLNKLAAASSSVQGSDVLVQGDFSKQIVDFLVQQYSLPRKCCAIESKLKAKKK